jgi:gluconate 2-dehydrogenase alpha chain
MSMRRPRVRAAGQNGDRRLFALNNVRMLLLSGIGKPYDPADRQGTVGSNYAYQTTSAVQVFFDQSVNINPFMRSGANGTVIADFVSDNFDHGPLGIRRRRLRRRGDDHGRPIEFHPTPPGTPAWGAAWKKRGGEALQPHRGAEHPRQLGGDQAELP